MSPLVFLLATLVSSVGAGVVGSMLGLGGGIIVVPMLTLLMGVSLPHAVGASAVSVIATSTGAAMSYVRGGMANVRIGLWLALGGTAGALTGAWMGGVVPQRALYFLFAFLMAYSGIVMVVGKSSEGNAEAEPASLSRRLQLQGSFYDPPTGSTVRYTAVRPLGGLAVLYGAGIVGGLLGIGAGAFNVLAMGQVMRLPIKVSTATSTFMVGLTAAATTSVYFSRGQIQPLVAVPAALGVLLGAFLGTRIMPRLPHALLRKLFIPVLFYISAQMFWKGWTL